MSHYFHHRSSDILSRLDDDSLLELFEYARTRGSLRPLSLTCKWIRELCKPILFRRCCLRMEYRFNARYSIPETIWPHVRYVLVISSFYHQRN